VDLHLNGSAGCARYAVPLFGEVSDWIWAPISAIIFYRMFGGTLGTFWQLYSNFMEELFPGLDSFLLSQFPGNCSV